MRKKCGGNAGKSVGKQKRAGEPALSSQATNNYLDAAGAAAAADAEADASAAFFAFFAFFAFTGFAEASAAKAETANIPAIRAAIRFFIFVVSQKDFDEMVIQLNQTN